MSRNQRLTHPTPVPSALKPKLALVPALPAAPEPSDADLVEAIRSGSRGSREALYRRHVRYIGGMSARLLRSRELAEDVTQDTFVLAFQRIDELRDPAAVRGWLATIAVNLVRRHLRRQRFLGFFGLTVPHDAALDRLATDDASAETRAELSAIEEGLRGLPANHRIAWMLRHVEGHSLEETADACECSLATAKRWLSAAEHAMDEFLGKEPS